MKTCFPRAIKALCLLLGLVIPALSSSSLLAVVCTAEFILLDSQADVDDFQTTFGGGDTCDTVTGDLVVGGIDIADLSPLSALTSVMGNLHISQNSSLTNVVGLSALTTVGGFLSFYDNQNLTHIDGLSSLVSVGGHLVFQSNPALTDINGLESLTSVGGGVYIWLNDALAACGGLTALLDPVDDAESGPGPNASSIPDVAEQGLIEGNLTGCNSVAEILGAKPLFNINAGLNDAWYNPVTDGQGFTIIVFPEIEKVFMTWFTYDTKRPPEYVTGFLGDSGHRWLTAQGEYVENVAELEIYMTSGGEFNSPQPAPITEPDGEIKLEFSTCNAGTVTYDIPSIDRHGVVPIERIVLDNVSQCYMLNYGIKGVTPR